MTKRDVMIHMLTARKEMNGSLFEEGEELDEEEYQGDPPAFQDMLRELTGEMPEPTEMFMEGKLVTNEHRVELIYEEGELTGMDGSVTSIGFDRTDPSLVSMMRTGPVRTALTFEKGKRHLCLYNTPYSDFEVCVHALNVNNRLLQEGRLELDYLVEIHGAQAEHCKMTVSIRPIEKMGDNECK